MDSPPRIDAEFNAPPASASHSRPITRVVMHWIRRGHLYLGLFLFPWAVLYGFSGFLFNHPEIMSDQTLRSFDRSAWSGTAMAQPEAILETARQVVEQLRHRAGNTNHDLKLVESDPVRYAGEFAFGTITTEEGEIQLLFDAHGAGGVIRRSTSPRPPASEAVFVAAIGPQPVGQAVPEFDRLKLPGSLADRLETSVPLLIQNLHFPEMSRDQPLVKVTSVPDLLLTVEVDGRHWRTAYNSFKGTVSGKPADDSSIQPLTWRRFLTRLHTTHVYPLSYSAKWIWILSADVTALVLIYWGGSGLLMWWQIKSTRLWGWVVLTISAIVALVMGLGMHEWIRTVN